MQAAIGCEQLKKLPGFIVRRKRNWAYLREALEHVSDKLLLPEPAPGSDPSWFGFLMTVQEGVNRDAIVHELEGKGIQTRMLFSGNLLRHPCFDQLRESGHGYRVVGSLENTDRIVQNTFWVGVYPGLTDEMLRYMADGIVEAVKR